MVLPQASKEQRLKTGFLSRTIKLLADPAIPRVTRTHSPRTTRSEALIALLGVNVPRRQTGGW